MVMPRWVQWSVLGLLAGGAWDAARASTGNEFALDYAEARSARERDDLVAGLRGRSLYFRYLLVMEMAPVEIRGRPGYRLTTFEPSSLMDVVFTVDQPVSLAKLREDPPTRAGTAIAVRGRISKADPEHKRLYLDPVVVRHKDRMSPATGKEMLYELDPGAIFYSYTAGPRPLHVTYRDRDLVQQRERILERQGPEAWFTFLERELQRREQARRAQRGSTP